MKILFLFDNFFPSGSGGEYSSWVIAKEIARRGHDVTVLARNCGIPDVQIPKEIRVTMTNGLVKANPTIYANGVKDYIARYLTFIRLPKECRDVDVIIPINMYSIVAMSWTHKNLPILPIIRDYWPICPLRSCWHINEYACFNGYTKDCINCVMGRRGTNKVQRLYKYLLPIEGAIKRKVIDKMSLVAGVSKYILDKIGIKNGVVLYNGVDPITFNPDNDGDTIRKKYHIKENEIVISYFGKVTRDKGSDLLIECAKHLKKSTHNATLLIVGSISDPKAEKLSKMSNVIVTGWIPQDKIPGYYAASDIVIQTSLWSEPLSRTLLEAMSSGKLIIATRVGGTPEVIKDGETGYLIEPSSESLIEKIDDVLYSTCDVVDPSKKAIELILKRHTIQKVGDEYEMVIKNVVRGYHG